MTRFLPKAGAAGMLVAGIIALSACGGSDGGESSESRYAPPPETVEVEKPKPPPPVKKGIAITTGDSQFGEVLFDENERAIYYFDKEKTDVSECYGACAASWPPVFTDGKPVGKGPVRDGMLGTTVRKDGKIQATYMGRPLYYYVDEPAGQVLCHNVDEYGGLWLAIQPDGQPVP